MIYVGKAKSLRSRLNSYFTGDLHPRTEQMVRTARAVDWTVVSTEVEALQLEYTWIKQYDPRFNVRYRDDKSYPWLAVTLDEEIPRLQVMRGAKRKGVRYFGPYSHAWAIRETLDLLLRVFPGSHLQQRRLQAGAADRPALPVRLHRQVLGAVRRAGVGRGASRDRQRFLRFSRRADVRFLRRLETQMREAADEQEYERAARLRDDIGALRRAIEKQAVVLADDTDADAVAFAQDELEAAVFVFHVRGGRVRGQRGYVVDKLDGEGLPELVERFLSQAYLVDGHEVPREVLVPAAPPDVDVVAELLSLQRGTRVEIRVPQRGDKRSLLETVGRNAQQAFTQHKLRRASDLSARSRALSELQEALGLADAPLRIECFDVSSLQGTSVVASMVVFEDGIARKSEYRRFAIRGAGESNGNHGGARVTVEGGDVDWLYEAVRRRFARYLEETASPASPEATSDGEPVVDTGPRKFAYPPNLVVVDGGFPQVNAGAAALEDLGIDDVAICGLAKRLEEVWVPGDPDPIILPRTSEGLYLLQRVRDEAHRFAITYHRQKRSKSMVESLLDGVPGLGETRRKAVLARFGSLKRLRAATVEEIAEVLGNRSAYGGGDRRRAGRQTGRAGHRPDHGRGAVGVTGEQSTPAPAAHPGTAGDHHGSFRSRPQHCRQVPRGSRLVRRRQPAACTAAHAGRARRPLARHASTGSRRWSTFAAGRSSLICARRCARWTSVGPARGCSSSRRRTARW